MSRIKIKDNSRIPKESLSGISLLTSKIADKTLEQLENEGIFVFPEILREADDITKDQMKKYQKVAQNNMDVYKSGGDYVYNLTPETLTNLVSGRTKEFVVDDPLFWISKTYDTSNISTICQKRPNDDGVKSTVPQNYCLDILNQKLDYI